MTPLKQLPSEVEKVSGQSNVAELKLAIDSIERSLALASLTDVQKRSVAEFMVRALNADRAAYRAKFEKLVKLLKTVQGNLVCVGTNDTGDACGVTFTCGNCRMSAEITAVLAQFEKENGE